MNKGELKITSPTSDTNKVEVFNYKGEEMICVTYANIHLRPKSRITAEIGVELALDVTCLPDRIYFSSSTLDALRSLPKEPVLEMLENLYKKIDDDK